MMRDDEHPPDTALPRPGSLPAAAKTWREVFVGIERIAKEVGLPVLCLLAGKWGILEPKDAAYAFVSAVSVVLGGNFALRRGESQEK